MIETRLLYYFLAIARERSITKAADALHIKQPTLSKQIMDLERQLGKQLIIRGKKQLTLTEEGVYLRSRAQEMMELMEQTESALQNQVELVSGDIWLGCGESSAMELVATVFKQIQNDYPKVRFHTYSGDAEEVLTRLDKGLLDMGLLIGARQDDKYDYLSLKKKDVFGLLMPKDCTLASKTTISLADIQDIPLLFPKQVYNAKESLGWFGAAYSSLDIVATYNLVYNATFMVEKGIGYAFCLANLVNTEGRNLTFRPFAPEIKADLYIVTKKYQIFSPAVKIFLNNLRQTIQI